jgi:DNA-binding SARP family transcriptional activator/tetratricopeptide (TPR) repeat protein
VQFRVLGPVEVVTDDGRLITPSRRRERCLLAVLLLEPGHVVPAHRLTDLLWDNQPSEHARRALYAHVARLRAVLADADGSGVALISHGEGYLLRVQPDTIDAHQFRDLVEQAAATPDLDQRAERLRSALALWRGPALHNAATDRLRERLCTDLEELRLHAIEESLATGLALGRHGALISELAQLTAAHPLRSRLTRLYMLALHHTGRGADALDVYTAARTRLIEELGLDPDPELQRLHRAILRGEPVPTSDIPTAEPVRTIAPVVPAQLPLDTAGFTGRDLELGILDGLLGTDHESPARVAVCVIAGTAGVGKTALAVHFAHQVAARFPDGQLCVNLHGFSPTGPARSPAETIPMFLEALGVPPQNIPTGLDGQIALYRSRLAGKRILILLDNACDADQVRPLLPGSPTSMVVVTSRNQLTSLAVVEGARPLTVDLLSVEEARHLLAARIGQPRIAAEPDATAEIITSCARLPLALSIVAARAAAHPTFPLATLAEELRDTGSRLDALAGEDAATDVRAVLSWSYHALSDPAARLFRLLGLHPGPDIAAPAAASLAALPLPQTRRLLGELARANLIVEHTPGRYSFHDLLRAYAIDLANHVDRAEQRHDDSTGGVRCTTHDLPGVYGFERAEGEDPTAECDSAVHRLYGFYLSTVRAAATALGHAVPEEAWSHGATQGGFTFTDGADAIAWLEDERANLVAVAQHAATHGPVAVSWQLALPLRGYFWMSGRGDGWLAIGRAGLAAARRVRDRVAEAEMLNFLGTGRMRLSEYDEAAAHYEDALTINKAMDAPARQAANLSNLGAVYTLSGRIDEAIETVRHSIELYRALGMHRGEANACLTLANLYRSVGRLADAEDCARHSLATYRNQDFLDGQASALHELSAVYRYRGRLAEALEAVTQARSAARRLGTPSGVITGLDELLRIHLDAGRIEAADDLVAEALRLADETGDRQLEGAILQIVGAIALARDDPDAAEKYLSSACDLGVQTRSVHVEVAARLDLAQLSMRRGADLALATGHVTTGHQAAQAAGLRLLAAFADTVAAEVALACGAVDLALETGRRALEFHERGQVVPWIARTLLTLAQAATRTGNTREGDNLQARATRLIVDFDLPARPGAAGL